MAKLERDFQARLIRELKDIFKGCIIMKNDSSYIQGIPDLLILYKELGHAKVHVNSFLH